METKKKSELLEMITGLTRKYHSEYERAEAYRELSACMMRRISELENVLRHRDQTAEERRFHGSAKTPDAYVPLYIYDIEDKNGAAGRMPENRAAARS